MDLRKITILLLTLLLSLPMAAQKRKRTTKPKPAPVVEEPQEDPRITNMREMTQQIIIIDSIVVNKDQFLASIHLSSECGQLMNTGAFFRNQLQGTLYLNEMGNKVYFSQPDGHQQQLFTADKLGNEWSKPQPLQGLSEGIDEASYHIFMTRYDSRSGSFLKPENIGMPFNSEANDYMFAIDEANRIGYFVSDRRQPEGKACIYIFIPSDTRKIYDNLKYTREQIQNFADIISIADTWGDGAERKAALDRIKTRYEVHNEPGKMVSTGDTASAVELHSKEANILYQKLLKEQSTLDLVNLSLDQLRQKYHKANAGERSSMKSEILKLEEQALQLNASIKQLSKATRNAEINSKKH